MSWLDKLLGIPAEPQQEEQIATAEAVAQPLNLSGSPMEQYHLASRAKTRIANLEAKVKRQREKGVEEEYVQETLRELARWRRQLEFSNAEIEG